jgi:hypothetical protein
MRLLRDGWIRCDAGSSHNFLEPLEHRHADSSLQRQTPLFWTKLSQYRSSPITNGDAFSIEAHFLLELLATEPGPSQMAIRRTHIRQNLRFIAAR